MKSAEKAKERLIRTTTTTTYFEWRREVSDVLSIGGRKASEFRAPWRLWHAAGVPARRAAVLLIATEGIRLPCGRIQRLTE